MRNGGIDGEAGGEIDVLGVIEFSDTASGTVALDAMTKSAPVDVVGVRQINPGKLVIFIGGDVASVEIALQSGERAAGNGLVASSFFPAVHPSVVDALRGRTVDAERWTSVGVVDAASIADALFAADLGAKRADVVVAALKIGDSMGGRASIRFTGDLHELESAMAVAGDYLREHNQMISAVTIANPHQDVITTLIDGERS